MWREVAWPLERSGVICILQVSEPYGRQIKPSAPKGVTDASAPQTTNDIVFFSSEANRTRLGEIIDASTSATVLPLNGDGGTTIRSLKLDQWRGVHG